MDGYYHRRHLPAFSDIGAGQPELAKLFFAYYGAVFADGALSPREKSLAALAVAHAVQCPYCIDAYTSGSLEAGADLEQLTEAVHIAAAVRGGSTLLFGMQALRQAEALELAAGADGGAEGYFDRRHPQTIADLGTTAPALLSAEQKWEDDVFTEGALTDREKAAIAVACAHAIQCPYSIDLAVRRAKAADLDLQAMTEAVHVATAIRGGASLVHGIQMLEQVRDGAM